jgi:nicotinamide-nucleotide amidase
VIAEVISVGTELLLGEIVNSNAAEVGRRLAEVGFDAHYQVTVGDNTDRIVATLRTACERADVVVVTGGIGPTQDDLTKAALCELAGVAMVRDAPHAQHIHDRVMARRGVVLNSVLRMADLPAGAEPLPNGNGLALGVALRHNECWVFSLPGVPREMILMLDEQVMGRLRQLSGGGVVSSVVVRTRGLGESQVADRLAGLFASTNPSIAFRITDTEVLVRITAKAGSAEEAQRLLRKMENEVRGLLADALA